MQINLKEGVNPKADVRGSDVSFQPKLEESTVAQAGPTTSETFRAANLKYNPLGSVLDSLVYHSTLDQYEGQLKNDPGYSPFDDEELELIDGYNPELFIDSKSRQETLRIMELNERDKQVNETLADSGAVGIIASVAAGFTNPLYMVPFLGWARGLSVGRRVLAASAMGGGIEAVNEAMLHQLDSERTLDESAYAVAAGAIFSGILGSMLRNPGGLPDELIPDKDFVGPKLAKEMQESNKIFESLAEMPDVDQLTGLSAKLAKLSPLRALASPVASVRKMAAALGEQNVVTTARAAVETVIKRYDGMLVPAIKQSRNEFRAMKAANAGKMSYDDFHEQVAYALRNNDTHPNPYVQRAAESYRKNILKPMFDEAVQAGLLTAEHATKFAASYFPRMYNFGKIKSFSSEFMDDVAKWVRRDNDLTVAESMDIAREVYRQIINRGTSVETKTAFVIPRAGPLKARELAIPDNVLAKYLVNDPDSVLKFYARDMGVDLELTRRFGDTDLNSFRKEIEKDWGAYIQKAGAESPHLSAKLNRQMADDLEVMGALLDRLKGKYKMPANPDSAWVRAGRQLRNWSVLRNLGGMTISAFPDMARPLYNHGLRRWAPAIVKLALNPSLRRMARADMQRMGTALDTILNQRVRSISEQDFLPYTNSRFEAVMERMVSGTPGGNMDFGKLSGMSYWNTMLKTLSGTLSQDGLIRALGKNRVNAKALARAGIKDGDMVKRIRDQIKTHGKKEKGLWFGNSDMWDDVEAAMAFEGAVVREIDSTIVTPGIMDKPLWMSSEIGKVVGSLKSFAFSATNRQLIHALEEGRRGDFIFMQGVVGATTIGAMSWAIKQTLAGNDISDAKPHEIIAKGMDQGAVFGIGGEAVGLAKAVGISAGVIEDENISSMWARHGAIDTLMGPALGGIALGLQGSQAIFSDDPTGSDVEAFRRMMPYQNLFYARGVFDRMEEMWKDKKGVDR